MRKSFFSHFDMYFEFYHIISSLLILFFTIIADI
nr:MAG TPA: hypothetical protein [Caudoviricetes sp.]